MDNVNSNFPDRFRLIISEPWDAYESMIGTVVRTIRAEASGKVHLLLRTMSPQRYYLIAERYEGDDVSNIMRGKHMVVTIARVKDSQILGEATYKPQHVEFFAIGSLEPAD